MNNAIIIKPNDTVVTVMTAVKKGEAVTYPTCSRSIIARDDIPQYHKVCIVSTKKNEPLYKYGEFIGYAQCDIEEGDYVHTHNLDSQKCEEE